jgi:hypothetical protein
MKRIITHLIDVLLFILAPFAFIGFFCFGAFLLTIELMGEHGQKDKSLFGKVIEWIGVF